MVLIVKSTNVRIKGLKLNICYTNKRQTFLQYRSSFYSTKRNPFSVKQSMSIGKLTVMFFHCQVYFVTSVECLRKKETY